MKPLPPPRRLLQGAVLCSSLGLAGWLVRDAQRSAAPPVAEPPPVAGPASGASQALAPDASTFFGSSKSSADPYFRRFTGGTGEDATLGPLEPATAPTFFTSSKSMSFSGLDEQPTTILTRPSQAELDFLDSSKSLSLSRLTDSIELIDEGNSKTDPERGTDETPFLPNTKSTVTIRLPEVVVPPPAPRSDAPR